MWVPLEQHVFGATPLISLKEIVVPSLSGVSTCCCFRFWLWSSTFACSLGCSHSCRLLVALFDLHWQNCCFRIRLTWLRLFSGQRGSITLGFQKAAPVRRESAVVGVLQIQDVWALCHDVVPDPLSTHRERLHGVQRRRFHCRWRCLTAFLLHDLFERHVHDMHAVRSGPALLLTVPQHCDRLKVVFRPVQAELLFQSLGLSGCLQDVAL